MYTFSNKGMCIYAQYIIYKIGNHKINELFRSVQICSIYILSYFQIYVSNLV